MALLLSINPTKDILRLFHDGICSPSWHYVQQPGCSRLPKSLFQSYEACTRRLFDEYSCLRHAAAASATIAMTRLLYVSTPAAQNPPTKGQADSRPTPRMSDGHPDLNVRPRIYANHIRERPIMFSHWEISWFRYGEFYGSAIQSRVGRRGFLAWEREPPLGASRFRSF